MSNQVSRNSLGRYLGSENKYRLDANVSTTNAINEGVKWNVTEQEDIIGLTYDAVGGEFTCTKAGVYCFQGNVVFTANATGSRGLYMVKNSLVVIPLSKTNQPTVSATIPSVVKVNHIERMSIGDTMVFASFQNSGGALDIIGKTAAPANYSKCSIIKLI